MDPIWAMRLRPADAATLSTRLAAELWPMPEGKELNATQTRVLEAMRWTAERPPETVQGDFTLDEFWMHLTSLLSGISSVRRQGAVPAGPAFSEEVVTQGDLARALQVLLTSGHADALVQALGGYAEASGIVGPRRGTRISASQWRQMVEESHLTSAVLQHLREQFGQPGQLPIIEAGEAASHERVLVGT